MKILPKERYEEYEQFVKGHPRGYFMQSSNWAKVKKNWEHAVIVSEDAQGKIIGGMLVLILPNARDGKALLYAPRGPVCDYNDTAVLKDLIAGGLYLGRKHHAYVFKVDPMIRAHEQELIDRFVALGAHFTPGLKFKETVQPRFNYMMFGLSSLTPASLLEHYDRKLRYYVRFAQKKGVQCEICDSSEIDRFYPIYAQTGERQSFTVRPKEYLKGLLDAFGEDARLYLCSCEGKTVSGAVTVNYAGKTCNVYSASSNDYRELHPNDLMQYNMQSWAVETGCDCYDFQGISIDPEENEMLYGVYQFKKKFGGEVVELAGDFLFDQF